MDPPPFFYLRDGVRKKRGPLVGFLFPYRVMGPSFFKGPAQ